MVVLLFLPLIILLSVDCVIPHIVESLAFNQETIISDSSNSNTGNNTASDATTAHNNMQPYTVVNRWHRTA